jgi:hypothetical protein
LKLEKIPTECSYKKLLEEFGKKDGIFQKEIADYKLGVKLKQILKVLKGETIAEAEFNYETMLPVLCKIRDKLVNKELIGFAKGKLEKYKE